MLCQMYFLAYHLLFLAQGGGMILELPYGHGTKQLTLPGHTEVCQLRKFADSLFPNPWP